MEINKVKRLLGIYLWMTLITCILLLTFVIMFPVMLFPGLKRVVSNGVSKLPYFKGIRSEELVETFLTWTGFSSVWNLFYMNAFAEAYLHSKAPNPSLLAMDKKYKHLLDFQLNGRPLVVNFGSCT